MERKSILVTVSCGFGLVVGVTLMGWLFLINSTKQPVPLSFIVAICLAAGYSVLLLHYTDFGNVKQ